MIQISTLRLDEVHLLISHPHKIHHLASALHCSPACMELLLFQLLIQHRNRMAPYPVRVGAVEGRACGWILIRAVQAISLPIAHGGGVQAAMAGLAGHLILRAHTHTHTHTHTHACVYIHFHTYIHTGSCAHIHTRINSRTQQERDKERAAKEGGREEGGRGGRG